MAGEVSPDLPAFVVPRSVMKTWRVVALAVAVFMLLVAAGLLAAALAGDTWTGAAAWIEAISTAAAVGAALGAAILVGRTVQLELKREGDRLEAEKRSQAALVAAWPTGNRMSGQDRSAGERGRPVGPTGIKSVEIMIRNASFVPVSNASVRVTVTVENSAYAKDDPASEPVIVGQGHRTLGLVPPNDAPEPIWVDLTKLLVADGLHDLTEDKFQTKVSLGFVDAADVAWVRDQRGLRATNK